MKKKNKFKQKNHKKKKKNLTQKKRRKKIKLNKKKQWLNYNNLKKKLIRAKFLKIIYSKKKNSKNQKIF